MNPGDRTINKTSFFMVFISYFSHCVMMTWQAIEGSKGRKDFLAPSLRVQSSMAGKTWRHEQKGLLTLTHSQKAKRWMLVLCLFSPFYSVQSPSLDPSAASPMWSETLHLSWLSLDTPSEVLGLSRWQSNWPSFVQLVDKSANCCQVYTGS